MIRTLDDTPVFRALVDSRAPWQSPAELATAIGVDVCIIMDELKALESEEYIDIWLNSAAGPIVTFSAWGSDRLGLSLAEAGGENVFRWVETSSTRNPKSRRRPKEGKEGSIIDNAVDQRPGPADLAEQNELDEIRTEQRRRRREQRGLPLRPQDVPRPTIQYARLSPWGESRAKREERPARTCAHCSKGNGRRKVLKIRCQHCGRGCRPRPESQRRECCPDRPLKTNEICLSCRRWGWDEHFAKHNRVSADDDGSDAPRSARQASAVV